MGKEAHEYIQSRSREKRDHLFQDRAKSKAVLDSLVQAGFVPMILAPGYRDVVEVRPGPNRARDIHGDMAPSYKEATWVPVWFWVCKGFCQSDGELLALAREVKEDREQQLILLGETLLGGVDDELIHRACQNWLHKIRTKGAFF